MNCKLDARPHKLNSTRRTLRSRVAGVIGAGLLLLASGALAQPTRGAPVIRTPGRPGDPGMMTPPGMPVPPPLGMPTPPPFPTDPNAPPGGNGRPAPGAIPAAGDTTPADDPMAALKQASKEIEFKPRPAGMLVSFNLEDVDLPDLVKTISNVTGRRFLYGGKLRQIKTTVYSPEKITVAEAYSAFLSILETNGMTVIPHGRFLKIVETGGIVNQTTPVIGVAGSVPNEDRYLTRLYRLSHVDATEVATVLGKFKTKEGDITVYAPGNLLIITETGTNMHRLMRLIEEVDVGSAGDQLWIEPIHYASAQDIATKLAEILDIRGPSASRGGRPTPGGAAAGGGGGGSTARIISDDRTNSLVITASQGDYLRVLELIKRLDVPQTGEGEIHVLALQHAGCKELSGTLNNLLGNAAQGGRGKGAGAAPGGAPVPGSTEDIFEGQIRVTCDETSNKLVVTSSLRDYAALRNVIDELDRPRRQVFIEAVIMDVDVQRTTDFGLGYHGGAPFDTEGKQSLIFSGFNAQSSMMSDPGSLSALALGVRGPELENQKIAGASIPAFGLVLRALAEDGDSNVLATPHILATDNIAAEISIGQNIPLQTNAGASGLGSLLSGAGAAGAGAGALAGLAGSLGGLTGSGARQDVGTKISVTPHVNDSDQVRLELNEEISEQGATVGDLGAAVINKRSAKTSLIVKDQQTVVIGGLVRDTYKTSETKVPILGDIPVLGLLFKHSAKQKQKTNLLLVLTPYVVRDQSDLRAIFERKMQERQEFIDRYFVFSDTTPWEASKDYSRASGLVEEIRQAFFKMDEKLRLEEETKPRNHRTHEPGEAIALPSFGTKSASSAGAAASPNGQSPAQRMDSGDSYEPPAGLMPPNVSPGSPAGFPPSRPPRRPSRPPVDRSE